MKLKGKNIVLTGASRGFGFYLADRLRSEGANILAVARYFEMEIIHEDEVGSQINVPLDLSVGIAPTAILAKARQLWTHVDGLVNNAAIQGPVGDAWETNWGEWRDTMKLDFMVPVELCRLFVPGMIAQGGGKIVNLSGGGATSSRPGYSAYASAKTALVRFNECLADELKSKGVDVNCVSPGKMPTDMLPQGVVPDENSMERAVDLIVWLLSDESKGITGKLISAIWDDWENPVFRGLLELNPDLCTLRRIDEATSYGQTLERIDKARRGTKH